MTGNIILLTGKHAGLMNNSFTLKVMQYLLNILEFIPIIKKIVRYLRLTKYGKKIRSIIRLVIRGGDSSQRASYKASLLENDIVLKNMALFINKFHSLK